MSMLKKLHIVFFVLIIGLQKSKAPSEWWPFSSSNLNSSNSEEKITNFSASLLNKNGFLIKDNTQYILGSNAIKIAKVFFKNQNTIEKEFVLNHLLLAFYHKCMTMELDNASIAALQKTSSKLSLVEHILYQQQQLILKLPESKKLLSIDEKNENAIKRLITQFAKSDNPFSQDIVDLYYQIADSDFPNNFNEDERQDEIRTLITHLQNLFSHLGEVCGKLIRRAELENHIKQGILKNILDAKKTFVDSDSKVLIDHFLENFNKNTNSLYKVLLYSREDTKYLQIEDELENLKLNITDLQEHNDWLKRHNQNNHQSTVFLKTLIDQNEEFLNSVINENNEPDWYQEISDETTKLTILIHGFKIFFNNPIEIKKRIQRLSTQ